MDFASQQGESRMCGVLRFNPDANDPFRANCAHAFRDKLFGISGVLFFWQVGRHGCELCFFFFFLSRRLTMDNAVVPSYQQPLLDAQIRVGGHDAADGGCRHRVLHKHSCVTRTHARAQKNRSSRHKNERAGQGTVCTTWT